jgi:hypothetical protein
MRDLAPIFDFLKTSRTKFISTANEIPDSKWRQSPGVDIWSAAEIVAHVGMIEKTDYRGLQKGRACRPAARFHAEENSPPNRPSHLAWQENPQHADTQSRACARP